MANTDPQLILNMLECRIGSFTTQHIMRCSMIRKLLSTPPTTADIASFSRVLLRSDRTSAHLRQDTSFETIGTLGKGGFGIVQLVRSKNNNKYYALKTIRSEKRSSMMIAHTEALLERDCALLANSASFVKLKAAWLERNSPSSQPDSFKFLWEIMPYGDMNQLIKQLHPMTAIEDDFCKDDLDKRFFNFHDGTYRSLITSGKNLKEMFQVNDSLLGSLFCEIHMIKEGNMKNIFTYICFHYTMQLVQAVKFLHDRHVTHHDLKPGNIMVARDLRLKVGDMGLATGFLAQHIPDMHGWTEIEWLEDNDDRRELVLGGAKPQNTFFKERLSRKRQLPLKGSRWWLPPEHFPEFYEDPAFNDRTFCLLRHRATDWYAVGVIAFQLMTGLHPIGDAHHLYGDKLFAKLIPRSKKKEETLIKLYPQNYNLLFYCAPSIKWTDFERLLLDRRMHALCLSFMAPDPQKRLDFARLMNDDCYLDLKTEFNFPTTPLPFRWNQFLRCPQQPKSQQLLEAHAAGTAVLPNPPKPAAPIPSLPGFPFMTASPGIIATPPKPPPTATPAASTPSVVSNLAAVAKRKDHTSSMAIDTSSCKNAAKTVSMDLATD